MALNVDTGRKEISEFLPVLKDLYTSRPNSSLPALFAETKLDELINIYSKAPQQERENIYKTLSSVYPTYLTRLEPLKQPVK